MSSSPAARTADPASRARRLAPFLAAAAAGVLVTSTAADLGAPGFWIGGALIPVVAAMVVWAPWHRLPSWAGVGPALVFLLAVVFLRHAAGGSTAGISPLVLLPVLWLGLYGTRLQLAIVVPAIGAAFFMTILVIGDPTYPAGQWRAAALFVVVSLLIGPNVQRLIGRVKAQAEDARNSEREIARVAEVARRLSSGDGTRRDVCVAACDIGAAGFALLWEPGPHGRLAVTAAAGVEPPEVELDPSGGRSVAVQAYRTGAPVFALEARNDERISDTLQALTGDPVAVLCQPVIRRGEPEGVLVVGWRNRIDRDEDRVRVMVGLLAAEAAIAIERADLMTQLEAAADTDELTGLPNRRGWNRELDIALSTADRRDAPLCVALIDVDFFKAVNDQLGHQAGDRLLKSAAAAWRSTLRPADVLARPGGDEFSLLLPDCDLDCAQTVLERLREATPAGSTCSIGVAEWEPGEAPEELITRADRALYGAKDGGRDRVVTA